MPRQHILRLGPLLLIRFVQWITARERQSPAIIEESPSFLASRAIGSYPRRITLRITCGLDRRGPCVVCKARDGTDRQVHALVMQHRRVRNLQYRDMWPWTYDL